MSSELLSAGPARRYVAPCSGGLASGAGERAPLLAGARQLRVRVRARSHSGAPLDLAPRQRVGGSPAVQALARGRGGTGRARRADSLPIPATLCPAESHGPGNPLAGAGVAHAVRVCTPRETSQHHSRGVTRCRAMAYIASPVRHHSAGVMRAASLAACGMVRRVVRGAGPRHGLVRAELRGQARPLARLQPGALA